MIVPAYILTVKKEKQVILRGDKFSVANAQGRKYMAMVLLKEDKIRWAGRKFDLTEKSSVTYLGKMHVGDSSPECPLCDLVESV